MRTEVKPEHIIFVKSSILKLIKMRNRQQIIKEWNEAETFFNRLIMTIGQLYADYSRTNDPALLPIISQEILASQEVELQLRILEQELANTNE